MQRKAAETLEGPVLILAGAGSGKTRTLTYRIANLISRGVKPWNILALTFTNKAAREMRDRVEKLVGADADEMWIGTFHSVCVRILRRDIEKLGYQRSFTIYDDDDQLRVIKDGVKALGVDEGRTPPKEIRNKISDAKNKMLTPDEWFQDSVKDYQCQQFHDVYCYYEERLRAANALDFDDLLLRTLQLFVDHPPVLDYYRQRFQYVHVDEYQDTNAAQYTLVRLLTQESRNLCVVGDDDQSIYGWRGADIRNILDFEKDFPDAQVIKLEQNYRSTANILDAANQVIAHNVGRKEKALWTDAGEGEKIHLYSAGDEREEAAWICERVRKLQHMQVPYAQMAVLYRMHAQSRVIEEMFTRAGIPYKIFGGTRFYDRKEIRDALAYLRVIVNPADDVSLVRIINTPKRSIGDSTVAALQEHAQQEELPLFSVLNDPPEALSSRPRKCIGEFALLLMRLTAMKDTLPLGELVETMLKETGLKAQFEIEGNEEAQTRLQNLMEFAGAAKEFENQSPDKTLEAFLENVALVTDLDQQEEAPQYVTLMTLHSAKGLEFPHVYLTGMEENIFPSYQSVQDYTGEAIEEERRLAYVGITRAMQDLTLTRAQCRMIRGEVHFNPVSRFAAEIPEDLVDDDTVRRTRRNYSFDLDLEADSGEIPFGSPSAGRSRSGGSYSAGSSFGGKEAGGKPASAVSASDRAGGISASVRKRPKAVYSGRHTAEDKKPFIARTSAGKTAVPGSLRKGMPAPAEPDYGVGDRVSHIKYGSGTVSALEKTPRDYKVTVQFEEYGQKVMYAGFAKLKKI